jgi:lon-related putative ATP-dependent protease
MSSKNTNELSYTKLRRYCDASEFKFSTTEKLSALNKIIGQDRAMHALAFGVNITSHNYHIYALGPVGTGKFTIIKKLLNKIAVDKNVPDDWLYVNNFENRDKPKALRLPAGKGHEFRDDIDQMVEELKTGVPKAFESKEYEKDHEKIEQDFQKQIKDLLQALEKAVSDEGFVLVQTTHGMAVFPVINDKILTPDQYNELDEKKRSKLEKEQEELQAKMREVLRKVEQLQKEEKERIRDLDRRVVGYSVDHLVDDLKNKYSDYPAVVKFLAESRAYLMKNVGAFKQIKQMEQLSNMQKVAINMSAGGSQEISFDEYKVNLVVDNKETKGAPVIIEKNPIGPNLIGRIEQQGWFGTLVTNFRMIKGGSLHRANGGYLLIDALELLQRPLSWDILKRSLKNREIATESMSEALGVFMTRTLEPEPIPLDLKVIFIGSPLIYYLLLQWDPDFKELFKVKADFEVRMNWEKDALKEYSHFIGAICREENLKHFSPSGVAKVVEHGARDVEHQQKLSTKFGDIVDLVRQSSYWAEKNGHNVVDNKDVEQALEEQIYRSNSIEKHIQEYIEDGSILLDTTGKVVGQINGLSVLSLGDYSFGKPSRITVRTFMGHEGVVHIDREVNLGGRIHNKGAMILTGYLGGKFALNIPMVFSATITFEQLYEEVEGDSASSVEMYALLSSLSELPIRQDLAVTGSVNQRGEIQPIGGVNDKIEGFFQACKIKGFTGTQGVVIPHQNVRNLMLHEYVVEAVKKGKFHIYAVKTIDEGIELLTGKPAGHIKADGTYPKNTVNALVQAKIEQFAEKAKKFALKPAAVSPRKKRK